MESINGDALLGLVPELFFKIISFLPLSSIVNTIPLVCRSWRTLHDHDSVWQCVCEKSTTLEKKPSATWKQWAYIANQTKWDVTSHLPFLKYSQNGTCVEKLCSPPDVNYAFVKRSVDRGIAFFEFFIKMLGDEMWIGITNHPEDITMLGQTESNGQYHSAHDIIGHQFTWAFCNRRLSFQFGGATIRDTGHCYGSGDKVGMLVDVEQRKIDFYLNGKLVGSNVHPDDNYNYPLPENQRWTAFVMLDYAEDVVTISDFY